MEIRKTATALALGNISAMTIGTALAKISSPYPTADDIVSGNPIIAVSEPGLRVTVYDGIATLVGNVQSVEDAEAAELEIREIPGVEYVINLITWG